MSWLLAGRKRYLSAFPAPDLPCPYGHERFGVAHYSDLTHDKRRLYIQSGRDGHRENLDRNRYEKLKASNSFSLENGKYQA